MKVGVSSVCITPDRPIWMAGFGDRTKRSEGKYQDIFLKVLSLEDVSGKRVVLVTSDLLGYFLLTDSIKAEARKRFGLEPSELLLNASHTHTGPLVRDYKNIINFPDKCDEAYSDELVKSALTAIEESINDLETARLFRTKGTCTLSVNRRKPLKEDPRKVDPNPMRTTTPNPQGVTDPDVPILKVIRDDGSVKAILFLYACHPSTMDGYLIGGDYPGFAQRFLEEEFKGATALFLQGCGGDLKARNVDAHGRLKYGFSNSGIEVVKCHGRQLSQAVLTALAGKLMEVDGLIITRLASVQLPFQPIPQREELEAQVKADDRLRSQNARMVLEALDQGHVLPRSFYYTIQLISIGYALSFLGLQTEVVVDYSIRFKREFGENVWVLGYCNGPDYAYVASARMIPEGGYEVEGWVGETHFPTPFSPQIEEIIAGKVQELFIAPSR